MATRKGGLGRGLDALFVDNAVFDEQGAKDVLKISEIEPNRNQPRKDFDEQALSELADSIGKYGILQPILVRPLNEGIYQIIAGERRWRAARMAGLKEVPVIIKDVSNNEVVELALIENLQREDLNPIEEAEGYQELIEKCGYSQEELSRRIDKSRPAITNALRLLKLPQKVQTLVRESKLSAGHARALLAFSDEEEMIKAAEKTVNEDLSVRELEKMAKKKKTEPEKSVNSGRDPFFDEVELALSSELGRKVKVIGSKGRGVVEIEFYSNEDLSDIALRLAGEN